MVKKKDEENQEETEEAPQLSLIERAEAAAARIERAEAEIKATEARLANQLLGGGTNSAQPKPRKTQEQIKKEESIAFFAGTGIDKSIEKYG